MFGNKRGQLPPTYDTSREPEPVVYRHEESRGVKNLVWAFILFLIFGGIFLAVHYAVINGTITLSSTEEIIVAIVIAAVYAIILFFLIERRETRTTETYIQASQPVQQPMPQPIIIEKPVIHEVEKRIMVDRPVEVIRTVEKRVIRRVPGRTVYIQPKTKKLNIPKYEFIGSDLTKVYHKRSCRFRKSIKRKYEIVKHNEFFFKRNGYTPCGLCMLQKHNRVEKANASKSARKR